MRPDPARFLTADMALTAAERRVIAGPKPPPAPVRVPWPRATEQFLRALLKDSGLDRAAAPSTYRFAVHTRRQAIRAEEFGTRLSAADANLLSRRLAESIDALAARALIVLPPMTVADSVVHPTPVGWWAAVMRGAPDVTRELAIALVLVVSWALAIGVGAVAYVLLRACARLLGWA